jgi:hypothetical protein
VCYELSESILDLILGLLIVARDPHCEGSPQRVLNLQCELYFRAAELR